jgi:hypothetical protein
MATATATATVTVTAKAQLQQKPQRRQKSSVNIFHPLCSADGLVDEVMRFGLDLF